MKKQTGIWLDYKEANFIELLDGDLVRFHKLDSGVDTSKARGAVVNLGKSGGMMAGVSEKKFENRRRNEERDYFVEIMDHIRDADEVVIFGPGEARDLLVNAIKEHPNQFNSDLMAVLTTDNMTENQKVAYVKTFFEAN